MQVTAEHWLTWTRRLAVLASPFSGILNFPLDTPCWHTHPQPDTSVLRGATNHCSWRRNIANAPYNWIQNYPKPSWHVPTSCGVRSVPVTHDPYHSGEGLLYWELLDLVHVQAELVREGVLLRGALTIGDIFIKDAITFGPALIRAYELESTVAITPRVIIDPLVFILLEQYPALRGNPIEDEMQYLCRVLKKDRDGVWFIDYLRAWWGKDPRGAGSPTSPMRSRSEPLKSH